MTTHGPRMLFLSVSLLHAAVAPARAQTGVDDDRVSLPDGPGSLEGVGDNVEIDPNMGTMRWDIPVEVPRGFPGMEPDLGLSYSSGAGTGVLGIGWDMSQPTIERMTSKGVPLYTLDDRFAADGGEELVLTDSGGTNRVYRARYERGFVRYTWHEPGTGTQGWWTAEYPDGRIGYFGADATGQLVASARTAHPTDGVFRYHLVEMVDPYGHSVRYDYDAFSGNRALLVGVRWVFVGGQPRYTAQLTYENRPDTISDCGAGFEENLNYRLSAMRILSGSEIIREYVLDYQDSTQSGGASRLSGVRHYGVGGRPGGLLYPLRFGFEYSKGLGATCASGDTSCVRPYLVDMGTLTGGVNLGAGNATLIDINGDALPDVLDTSDVGAHRFFINTLTPTTAGWTHGFMADSSDVATGGSYRLSSNNVQTLDVNGDGYSDLVNTTTGAVLLNDPQTADWAVATALGVSALPDLTGSAFPTLRFTDYDNDKRIDVLQSTSSETRVYHNTASGFVSRLVDPIGLGFSTSKLQLAEINGDGLSDPVEVLADGSMQFRINLGRGHWSAARTIPGVAIPNAELDLVDLEDLNGDGLDDLVIVVGTTIKYALNRNARDFDPFVTITSTDINGTIPSRESGVTVLYADMNGNGSEDVVWFEANGKVSYLELFPVRPNLLTRITNGIGMVQDITYGTSVEHAARARVAGNPWAVMLPSATAVVDKTDRFVTLTGSADGSGVHEVTTYDYRNGYYDGVEKQFRGFTHVTTVLQGDASQEEGTTRYVYDNGEADDYRNGLLLSEEVSSAGRVLNETTHTYGDCPVAEVPTVLDPPVRHVCKLRDEILIKEGAAASAWVLVRSESTWDGYGNITLSANHGVVQRGGVDCGAQCLGDEDFVQTAYVPTSGTGGRWLVNAPSRIQRYRDSTDALRSDEHRFYDGTAFVGLPEGQLTRGFLSRIQRSVNATESVDVQRSQGDANGNVVAALDANGSPSEANAHRRTSAWDDSGLFLAQSDVFLTDPEGQPYQLRRNYSWDVRFQKLLEATDHMLVRNGTVTSVRRDHKWAYDEFGRIVSSIEAGDDRTNPTQEYTYELADPVSRVTIHSRSRSGQAADEIFHRCMDGKGRRFQDRLQVAPGSYQVTGFRVFNNRDSVVEEFQPYTATSGACDAAVPTAVASTRSRYDAIGRLRSVEDPDASIYGSASVSTVTYEPLVVVRSDEEDNDSTSAHANTPTTTRNDGLGRVIALERTLRTGSQLTTATTRLEYDNLGNLSARTDPDGNVHRQTYDRLGRPVEVQAPNTGTTQFTHDAAGNLLTRTDARGVTTVHQYDGANRLVARFEQGNENATRTETRYDADPACAVTSCTNTAGRVASRSYPLGVDSPVGAQGGERMGYSARGATVYMERILGGVSMVTKNTLDNRRRRVKVEHPDGTQVQMTYDRVGRMASLPGYVDAISYDPRGAVSELHFSNQTRHAWTRDVLQRVTRLATYDGAGGIIESRDYTFNRASRITTIVDGSAMAAGIPRQDAEVTYDAWYRPLSVKLASGTAEEETLSMAYGLVDQVQSVTSSRGASSPAHVGAFNYATAQPLAAAGAGGVTLSYDAAGNATQRGNLALSRDHLGRLKGASGNNVSFAAGYDSGEKRVFKRDGSSLVLYASDDFEVRDGVSSAYVSFGGRRVARHRSTSLGPTIYPDVAPVNAVDGSITAGDVFVALARAAGDLPGAAPTMDADLTLTAVAARMLAEDADATTWLHGDHLGSITVATDEGGAVTGRQAFYPFGLLRAQTGYVDARGFTGQELDVGTGLLHFRHRDLDPLLGRWLSADPAFALLGDVPAERVPEATGTYAYVSNDPFNAWDPNGLNKDGPKKKARTKNKGTGDGRKKDKDDTVLSRLLEGVANATIDGPIGSFRNDIFGFAGIAAAVGALAIAAGVLVPPMFVGGAPEDDETDEDDPREDTNNVLPEPVGGDSSDLTPELVTLAQDSPAILSESVDVDMPSVSPYAGGNGELDIRIAP